MSHLSDSIPFDKSCPICLTLINDPQKCNNCKNKFCYNCIKNIKKCPLCRVEPFPFSKYIEEKKPINDDNPFKPISFKYIIPELKIKTKECLEMYLDERDYIKEKIPKWRDYVINDLKLFLEHYFQDFNFFILLYIIKKPLMSLWINNKDLGFQTDGSIRTIFETQYLNSYLEIFGCFNYQNNENFKTIEKKVKLICQNCCIEILKEKQFDNNKLKDWVLSILTNIYKQLEKTYSQFRFYIHVNIIEKESAKYVWGMKYISSNINDNCFHYEYENDSLYCNIHVFGTS